MNNTTKSYMMPSLAHRISTSIICLIFGGGSTYLIVDAALKKDNPFIGMIIGLSGVILLFIVVGLISMIISPIEMVDNETDELLSSSSTPSTDDPNPWVVNKDKARQKNKKTQGNCECDTCDC
jgi:formate hydrogenlyase subunit 3/multisubunit Na+/H+ antiporter MnhD subunit